MKASVHRMEIDRIRFVLSSYLRSRLQKVSPLSRPSKVKGHPSSPPLPPADAVCRPLLQIERFFPHVLEKEKTRQAGEPSLLSPEEFAFAKE